MMREELLKKFKILGSCTQKSIISFDDFLGSLNTVDYIIDFNQTFDEDLNKISSKELIQMLNKEKYEVFSNIILDSHLFENRNISEFTFNINPNQKSILLSKLGYNCIYNGDIEALKYFYINISDNYSAVIETINMLNYHITPEKIRNDKHKIYSDEFLYYLGMIYLGDFSRFIVKDLLLAEECFKCLANKFIADIRLSYIKLLMHDDIIDEAMTELCILKSGVKKKDFFSNIWLAKIVFDKFISKKEIEQIRDIPVIVINLLKVPLSVGHPLAASFYIDILKTFGFKYPNLINNFSPNPCALLDYNEK